MLALRISQYARLCLLLIAIVVPCTTLADVQCPCKSFEDGTIKKYIDADDSFSCRLKIVGGGVLLTVEARRDVKKAKSQDNLVKATAIILHNSKYNGRCTTDIMSNLESDCSKKNDICNIVDEDDDSGEVKKYAMCYAILHKLCSGIMSN